ncbi:hypothetical protein [Nocardioides convexus]|uniref:hypothetical protein n=1 Tax=Nocardioides convexus TaxID=2712224 RepID=UPI0024184F76|nr:hypothetical protein [Nocardioides convexus]
MLRLRRQRHPRLLHDAAEDDLAARLRHLAAQRPARGLRALHPALQARRVGARLGVPRGRHVHAQRHPDW